MKKLVCIASIKVVPCILLFLSLFNVVKGQKNFQPGFIIDNDGNRTGGLIDNKAWHKSPKTILFKKTGTNELDKYSVSNLFGFGITGGDSYVKAIISKDIRPVTLDDLTPITRDSIVTDTVFLRTLVIGEKLSLFEFTDFKNHFYIRERNSKLYEELTYKVYLVKEPKYGRIEQALFRNQLIKYLPDSLSDSEKHKKLERVRYNENPLKALVKKINNDNQHTKVTNKPSFFVSGGISSFNMEITADRSNDLYNLQSSSDIKPVFGLGLEFASSRNLKDFAIRLELSYSTVIYEGSKRFSDWIGNSYQTSYSLEMKNIIPSVTLAYSFLRSASYRSYFGARTEFFLSSITRNQFEKIDERNNQSKKIDNYLPFEEKWIALSGQLGIVFKNKIELNTTYSLLGEPATFLEPKVSHTAITLRAVYLF
jgi:hypothetical protein